MTYDYDSHGLLREVRYLEPETTQPEAARHAVTLVRDDRGNVIRATQTATDATPIVTAIEYDELGVYPSFVRSGLHEGLGMPGTRLAYDAEGNVLWSQGQDGSWLVYNRDRFGGLHEVRDSLGGVQSISIVSGENTVGPALPLQIEVSGNNRPTTVRKLDAFGRLAMTRSWDFRPGDETWVLKGYDAAGRLAGESRPYKPENMYVGYAPTNGVARFQYDDLGRLTQSEQPYTNENGQPATLVEVHDYLIYSGWRKAQGTAPAEWASIPGVFVHRKTVEGRVTVDFISDSGATTAGINEEGVVSIYTPNALGQIRRAATGNVATVFTFDVMGQLTQIDHPDSGTHIYQRDGFGRVRSYTHNGLETIRHYDAMGRLEKVELPGDEGDITWTYDTLDGVHFDPRDVGKLLRESVVSPAMENSTKNLYYYGPSSSLSSQEVTIGVEQFTTQYSFDGLGRVNQVSYPSPSDRPLRVRYDRTAFGRVSKVWDADAPSAPAFWEVEAVDAYGTASQVKLGNGLTVVREMDLRAGLPTTSRLLDGSQVLDWDEVTLNSRGLPHLRSGSVKNEEFNYDDAGRLTQHITRQGTTVESTHTYDYDDLGNLVLSPNTGSIVYAPANTPLDKPHAARTTANGGDFHYDDNGNQTYRSGPDVVGDEQRISYTSFDLPSRVDVGPEALPEAVHKYAYDGQLRRLKHVIEGVEATIYVGEAYRRRTIAGGAEEHVATIDTPDGPLVTVNLKAGGVRDLEYHFLDRLGSVRMTRDSDGDPLETRRYQPFGEEIRSGTPGAVRAGFTGHEQDRELGLINMRGRVYDPMLGRFLTPDPIVQNPLNLQSWNPYSYIMNSPLAGVDPSGFECVQYYSYQSDARTNVDSCKDASKGSGSSGSNTIGIMFSPLPTSMTMAVPPAPSAVATPTDAGRLRLNNGAELREGNYLEAFDSLSTAEQYEHMVRLTDAYTNEGDLLALLHYGELALSRPASFVKLSLYEDAHNPMNIVRAIFLYAGALAAAAESMVATEAEVATGGAGSGAKYVATTEKSAIALSKQLASEAQLGEMAAGTGTRIAGAGSRATFRDAGRVAQTYGGNPADWVKMSSSGFRAADGTTFATHWVENIVTGMKVEPKVVIDVFGGL
ncbi:MAG: RHS repeat-associated core domain-containing protein [Myxococcales bacterium]